MKPRVTPLQTLQVTLPGAWATPLETSIVMLQTLPLGRSLAHLQQLTPLQTLQRTLPCAWATQLVTSMVMLQTPL